jgi:hypothetical protein
MSFDFLGNFEFFFSHSMKFNVCFKIRVRIINQMRKDWERRKNFFLSNDKKTVRNFKKKNCKSKIILKKETDTHEQE